MNDVLKYSFLVGLAIFGIGYYVVSNQPDSEYIVVEKIEPYNVERGAFVIVCHGNHSGEEYRFQLPPEDFELVRVNHRLRPTTVERWEQVEGPRPRREPNLMERLFMR
jgi:hypothetical protein